MSIGANDRIVAMIEFQGALYIATERGVYRKVDEGFIPIEIHTVEVQCESAST